MVPVPDRDTAPYWAALADGRFTLQHCTDCDRWTWPSRPLCSGCHGGNLRWEDSPGTGEIYSWVITHQPYAPDLVEQVPYTVALVRLDEQDDILVPGRLASEAEVYQGMRVRVAPERVSEDVGVLMWAVDETEEVARS
jgi:uncharacterized OB-fold protein